MLTALSPDGTQVVVTRTDADANACMCRATPGRDRARLTATAGAVAQWSPDESGSSSGAIEGTIRRRHVLLDVDAGREQQLTTTGGWPCGCRTDWRWPTWSRTDGNLEIQVVRPAEGHPRQSGPWRINGSHHPFAIAPMGVAPDHQFHGMSPTSWLLEPALRE